MAVRISDWTFPNNNHIVVPGPDKNDPWPHVSVWAVPTDDAHTMRFRLCSLEENDPANSRAIERSQKFDPRITLEACSAATSPGSPGRP